MRPAIVIALAAVTACGRIGYGGANNRHDGGADAGNAPHDAGALDARALDARTSADAPGGADALTEPDAGDVPWLDGPTWRRRLTFDNSGGEAALEGFAVPLFLDAGRIDYSAAGSGGASLRFTALDGTTPLPHEVESWMPGGTSVVWVRAPSIEVRSTAAIWMYWGEPGAADTQRPADVWDARFAGVWHVDPGWLDSTGNGHTGTARGTPGYVSGVFAAAVELDGIDDWIELGDSEALRVRGGASFTWEAWVRTRDTIQQGTVFRYDDCDGSDGDAMCDAIRPFGLLRTEEDESLTFVYGAAELYASTGSGALAVDVWHHVAAVGDAAERVARLYVDGVLVGMAPDASPDAYETTGQYLMLGGWGDELWPGAIDEPRVSVVARSRSWVAAQHAAGRDAFVEYGLPEPRP